MRFGKKLLPGAKRVHVVQVPRRAFLFWAANMNENTVHDGMEIRLDGEHDVIVLKIYEPGTKTT